MVAFPLPMAQPSMAASLSRLRLRAPTAQSAKTFATPLTVHAARRPEMSWNRVCHSCFQRLFSASSPAAGGSSSRWKARQSKDRFSQEAKVQGLKSRAAFKLLELDAKHRLFKAGQTVVDLGYAPGSWSQVALERTKPSGRIVGIDLIPAQPPRGVSTIQGNFLSPAVRSLVKELLVAGPARPKMAPILESEVGEDDIDNDDVDAVEVAADKLRSSDIVIEETSYIDLERQQATSLEAAAAFIPTGESFAGKDNSSRLVDVVLSDMSEPWPQTYGFWLNTLSNPYYRMMNTSGMPFRDHAGSMDLCNAALEFASDTLRPGGHFVCKYYQGNEDKAFEKRLRKLFARVFREKPESSRSESKEAYFVALRRRGNVNIQDLEEAS